MSSQDSVSLSDSSGDINLIRIQKNTIEKLREE